MASLTEFQTEAVTGLRATRLASLETIAASLEKANEMTLSGGAAAAHQAAIPTYDWAQNSVEGTEAFDEAHAAAEKVAAPAKSFALDHSYGRVGGGLSPTGRATKDLFSLIYYAAFICFLQQKHAERLPAGLRRG